LTIAATDRDHARAAILAEAYAAATIQFLVATTSQSHEDALAAAEAELDSIEESITELERQRNDDPGDGVLQARITTELTRYGIVFQRVQDLLSADEPLPPLQVLGTAQVTELDPGGISAPTDRRARALLAGAVGLVLGLGLALTVDRLDTRLREREDVEEAFGLPVLAEIPRLSRRARADYALVTVLRPESAAAEAYRSLRSAITLVTQSSRTVDGSPSSRGHTTPQVLVVTGADGGEGKSTTAVNLAAAVAETGRSVILIDCDFRKPEAHLYLDAAPGNALAELAMTGANDFSGYLDQIIRPTAVRGVDLVSSMKPIGHPASVVSRLSGIISDARLRADVVLIDCSPLLVTSDAQDVLQYADAVLVTCRVSRTTYVKASRARRTLQRADVPLLGVVLTGTPPPRGTPYGKPSRSQAILSWLNGLLRPPGPDTPSLGSDRDEAGNGKSREEAVNDALDGKSREEAVNDAPPHADDATQVPVPFDTRWGTPPAEHPSRRADDGSTATGRRRRTTQS
ncbi:MAG TPA: CpsD/CapB family tyrosine-protein kinase, partial [Jiangellaceae bacterium]